MGFQPEHILAFRVERYAALDRDRLRIVTAGGQKLTLPDDEAQAKRLTVAQRGTITDVLDPAQQAALLKRIGVQDTPAIRERLLREFPEARRRTAAEHVSTVLEYAARRYVWEPAPLLSDEAQAQIDAVRKAAARLELALLAVSPELRPSLADEDRFILAAFGERGDPLRAALARLRDLHLGRPRGRRPEHARRAMVRQVVALLVTLGKLDVAPGRPARGFALAEWVCRKIAGARESVGSLRRDVKIVLRERRQQRP